MVFCIYKLQIPDSMAMAVFAVLARDEKLRRQNFAISFQILRFETSGAGARCHDLIYSRVGIPKKPRRTS
jgi:hypothetical protein